MTEERETVTVEILDLTDDEWTMTIPEFISWIQDKVTDVPEEFRGNISITAKTHDRGDYDDIKITVSYTRPESDAEFNTRISRHQFWKEDRENRERKEYERLKAKYA